MVMVVTTFLSNQVDKVAEVVVSASVMGMVTGCGGCGSGGGGVMMTVLVGMVTAVLDAAAVIRARRELGRETCVKRKRGHETCMLIVPGYNIK